MVVAIGYASRLATRASSTGSPSGAVTSHRSSQRSSTSPRVTPSTTKGRLVRRSTSPSAGARVEPASETSTAPLRSGAIGLLSSSMSASALRTSRMRETLPCASWWTGRCSAGPRAGPWHLPGRRRSRSGRRTAWSTASTAWRVRSPAWMRSRCSASAPRSWACGAAARRVAAAAAVCSRRRTGGWRCRCPAPRTGTWCRRGSPSTPCRRPNQRRGRRWGTRCVTPTPTSTSTPSSSAPSFSGSRWRASAR